MANLVSRLDSTGNFSLGNIGQFDDFTISNNMYAGYFNGSSQYLSAPNTVSNFGTGDFTVECWIYPTSSVGAAFIGNQDGGTDNNYWVLTRYADGHIELQIRDNTSQAFVTGSILTPSSTWIHIAITRQSGLCKLFVNGVSDGTPTTITKTVTSRSTIIGAFLYTGFANYFPGFVSNVRIVKGTALYTSNFIPSTSITSVANTSLLTCQNSSIVDNSSNGYTITNTGTVVTNNITKTLYGAVFNGSSQYLTAPANAGFSFGTGDFTVECWMWTATFTNTYGRMIVDARPVNTNGSYWNFGLDNSGKPTFTTMTTGGVTILGPSSVATSSWTHFAVTRQSGTIRLFINGVSVATPITGNSDNISSSGLRIGFNSFGVVGGFAAETLWSGYISNLHIVKGTALYTATFTPPTKLTAVANTSLLALQTASVTQDSSINNLTLTNVGTVTASIPMNFGVSKQYDNGNLQTLGEFDEFTLQNNSYATQFANTSGTYLSVGTSSTLALGSGNFTIETWVYPTSFNFFTSCIWDYRTDGNAVANTPTLFLSSTGVPSFYVTAGTPTITASSGLTANAWNHLAVVRSGTNITMYLNGTSVGTASNSATLGIQTFAINDPQTLFNYVQPGYFSNFRIVKDTAVYTANFTPSTPLTAIANTTLLTCQNPTIVDNSPNAFTITNNGSATTTNIPSTFYAGYFLGDGNYLSIPSSTLFNFGTGDFTLEAWVYPINGGRAADALKYGTIISQFLAGSTGAGSNSWGLGIGMNGGVFSSVTLEADGASRLDITGLTFPLNRWHHVAVVRNSGTLIAYVNGSSIGNSSYASAITNNPSGSVQMGRNAYATSYNNWLNGYLSNVRVVKGTAVYTANFTPPTKQLTAIANTSLLALQTASVTRDTSINNLTITNNGTVTTSTPITLTDRRQFIDGTYQVLGEFDEFTIPNNSYSAQFGGGTQVLNTPSNAAFTFGTGDFTLEAWVYRTGTNPVNSTFSMNVFDFRSTEPQTAINIGFDGGNSGFANKMYVYVNGAYPAVSTTSIALNTWYHIAFVRSGGTAYLYINGAMEASYAISSNFTTSTCYIGGRFAAVTGDYRTWQGYISNLRIVKGTAVYTTNFTPSIGPLTAVANTSLLTCQNPTIVDNSPNAFTITNNGSVTTTNITIPF